VKNKKGMDRHKETSLKKKHNKEKSKNNNDNRMEEKTEKIGMPLF
jgi:hypothetical protein